MNNTQQYKTWLGDLKKAANYTKEAADKEALNMRDPNCQGTVSIPSFDVDKNKDRVNLPSGMHTNTNEGGTLPGTFPVTQPNGVGQGTYITPRDGNAIDAKATSPTTPLSKISSDLTSTRNYLAGLKEANVAPAQEFQMPSNLYADESVIAKLASVGEFMLGCEEGKQAVNAVIEKRAGVQEAANLIAGVNQAAAEYEYMAKEAAEQEQMNTEYMNKVAAAQNNHAMWLDSYNTDFEKQAYAQGAVDGEAMADAVEAGGAPEIAEGEISDEEFMATLQALVESGEIAPEEAEAILSTLGTDGAVGGNLEQLAAELAEAVQTGQISEEDAQVIAQAILEDAGVAGGVAPEEAAMAEKTASANYLPYDVQSAVSVVRDLFN